MFQIVRGDILDSTVKVICQQVNCQNAMGAGLAKAIYTRYPKVKTEYHNFCNSISKPIDLLGKVQIVSVTDSLSIVNIFSQFYYGNNGSCYTDYNALRDAFHQLNCIFKGQTIAFPYQFGCGLGGGDWCKIEQLMLTYLKDCDVIVYWKE